MSTIKAVLFDLDGTLLDTAEDLGGSLNVLLAEEGCAPLPMEQLRREVSNGGNALVKLGFGTMVGQQRHTDLYQRLLKIYGEQLADKTAPFPGVHELLEWIDEQDIAWGIVTNKPRVYTDPLLAQMCLQPAPVTVICPDDVTHAKPDPEPMLLACEQIGCYPQEAIYVGDHRRDIEAGNNAEMETIAALYGYIEDKEDPYRWKANHYAESADGIREILNNLI